MKAISVMAKVNTTEKEIAWIEDNVRNGSINPIVKANLDGLQKRFVAIESSASSLCSIRPTDTKRHKIIIEEGNKIMYVSREDKEYVNRVISVGRRINSLWKNIDSYEKSVSNKTMFMVELNILGQLKKIFNVKSSTQLIDLEQVVEAARNGNTTSVNILRMGVYRMIGAGVKKVHFKTIVRSYIKEYSKEIFKVSLNENSDSYKEYEESILRNLFDNVDRNKLIRKVN